MHIGQMLPSGGYLGPPLGALGLSWAPVGPQEGFSEQKAGSLDPPLGSQCVVFFVPNSKRYARPAEALEARGKQPES